MKSKKSKIISVVVVVLAVAWLIISNIFFDKFNGTFMLSDGGKWTGISYSVKEGDEDKFTAELKGEQKIKVIYNGELDARAMITLSDEDGNVALYELTIYQEYDVGTDHYETKSDLVQIS